MLLRKKSAFDTLLARWGRPVKEYDNMNGDITICSVSADEIIDDIGRSVPKGVPVVIPGDLAHKSKDLWRLVSQGRLFRLNINALISQKAPPLSPPSSIAPNALESEYNKAVAEIGRLREDLSRARTEAARAQAEVVSLQEARSQSDKLDDILSMLKDRSVPIARSEHFTTTTESPLDTSIPVYIPSQIKSDSATEGRVSIKEESSGSSSISDASKALREKRKKDLAGES
jgi:hypothetical protein